MACASALFASPAVAQEDQDPVILPEIEVRGDVFYGTSFAPVEGYAAPTNSTGLRSAAENLDTPAAVTVITEDVIKDADIRLLDDAADYVPGLNRGNRFGGTRDRLLSRGFETDILINGSRRGVLGMTDTYRVERIETLRGPAGALYGPGNAGAQINVVTKRPLYEPFYAFRGSVSDQDLNARGTIDVSQPLTEDGDLALRLNALVEYEDSFRQFIEGDAVSVAPSLRWDATDSTSFLLEGEWMDRAIEFDRGIPLVQGRIVTETGANFTEPDAGDNDNKTRSVQFTAEHFFTDDWSVTGRLGATRATLEGTSFDNRILSPFSLPAGTIGVNQTIPVVRGDTILRNITIRDQTRKELFADAVVNGSVSTAGIAHNLTFGVDHRRTRQENRDLRSDTLFITPSNFANTCLISISNPVYGTCSGLDPRQATNIDISADVTSVFAQDRIELTDTISAVFGLGYTVYDLESENLDSGSVQAFDDGDVNFNLGLVYRPLEDLSFWGRYATGVQAEPIVVDPVTGNAVPPPTFESFELGVKKDFFDGRLFAGITGFHQTQDDVQFFDSSTLDIGRALTGGELELPRRDGKNRSRGIELEIGGEILENLEFRFGYAYIDAEVVRGFEPSGTPLEQTPEHKLSALLNYRFDSGPLTGLSVGGAWIYEGDRRAINIDRTTVVGDPSTGSLIFIDEAGELPNDTLPGYHRIDAFAEYSLTENASLFLRVENIFNQDYVSNQNLIFDAQPGAPRTVTLGLDVQF
ncbi:MAG: TonB-dependent receptor [Pseudomonadota bacterium]